MARTRSFSRLRVVAAAVQRALAAGVTGPTAVLAAYRTTDVERRAFLRGLGGALSLAVVGAVPGCSSDDEPVPVPVDRISVAIIGGGLAGLHCAYRLQQAGADFAVFEASTRTGGRTFTDRSSFGDQVAELGGEFIDTNHTTMHTLAEELGIALDDREADLGPETVKEVWWVDGRAIPEETIVLQFSEVAPLMAQLVVQIDDEGDAELFDELDNTALSDWLDENVPVAEYPELHSVLTSAYRGEYGLETSEQSVLNLLYLIGSDEPEPFRIFGESDERYHATAGSQAFSDRLTLELGAQIHTERRLVRAAGSGSGPYTLVFETPDGTSTVEAEHVVFALPFTLLREVDLAELELSDEKRKIIAELGYGTNAKLIGAFQRRVWRVDHDASGSVTADLPFQQCWDSSVGQPGESGILTSFLGGVAGAEVGSADIETRFGAVVNELEPVFPGVAAAYTAGSAVRMHWPSYPFTRGSYACYRPGQWSFYGLEGERIENLHFCGEHTSLDFQGYMEGAAETGARAAGEILEDLALTPSATHRELLALRRGLPRHEHARRPAYTVRRRELLRRTLQRASERSRVS